MPQQLPNLIDRAIRTALSTHSPTCIIVPYDVQELDYEPPEHAFKMVPSSLGISWPHAAPDDGAIRQAAEILNAGSKVAILVGQGARGAREEITQVADILGAGVAKALLGKDVLSDELAWVTGSLGLLGTRPSYELMMDCDTLLTVGSNFPYTQFMPPLEGVRAIQIDIDGGFIGMRYPYELNLVADAATALRALLPLLERKSDRSWRKTVEENVADWWETVERQAMTDSDREGFVNPQRLVWELSARLPANAIVAADSGSAANWYARHLKFTRRAAGLALGHARHHGARGALCHRGQVRPSRSPGHRLGGRRRHADERHGRAHHHQAVLAGVVGPPPDRGRAAQQRPQPGDLGDAGHGRRAEVRRLAGAARCLLRRLRRQPRPGGDRSPRRPKRSARPGSGPLRRTAPPCSTSTPTPMCPPSLPMPPWRRCATWPRRLIGGDENAWGVLKTGIRQKAQEFLPGTKGN